MVKKTTILPTHYAITQENRCKSIRVLERRLAWRLRVIRVNSWIISAIFMLIVYETTHNALAGYFLTTAGGKIAQIYPIEKPKGAQ